VVRVVYWEKAAFLGWDRGNIEFGRPLPNWLRVPTMVDGLLN